MGRFNKYYSRLVYLLRRHFLVIILSLVLSLAYMGSSLTSCSDTVVGGIGGDHINGIIWLFTNTSHPYGGISHVTNFPFGENVAQPQLITSAVHLVPTWILAKLFGAFCGWNLMVLAGYMLSALLMYAFVYWLTRRRSIALFAAVALAFTPYHYWKTWGHLSYIQSEIFIALLWAFIAFWRNPNRKKAVLLGLLMAGLFYSDGYFILIGGLLMSVLTVYSLVVGYFELRHKRLTLNNYLVRFRLLVLSILVLILTFLPILFVDYHYKARINATLANTRGNESVEVETYGARPADYVLPSSSSPYGFVRHFVDNYRDHNIYSNTGEYNLYLGFIVLILGLVAVISSVRFLLDGRGTKLKPKDYRYVWLAGAFLSVALVAVITSFAPSVTILGVKPEWPTVIISHFTSYWRVFARLYLIISVACVALASLGLWFLYEKLNDRKRLQAALIVVVIAGTILEMMPINPFSRDDLWNINKASPTYWWLRDQKEIPAIAAYPIMESPQGNTYFGDQIIHRKPLLNSYAADDPELLLHRSLTGLADPQTLGALKTLGINDILAYRLPINRISQLHFSYGNYGAQVAHIDSAVKPLSYVLEPDAGFDKPELQTNLTSCRQQTGPIGGLTLRHLVNSSPASSVPIHFVLKGEPGQSVIVYEKGVIVDSYQFSRQAEMHPVDLTIDPADTVSIGHLSAASAGFVKVCDLGSGA